MINLGTSIQKMPLRDDRGELELHVFVPPPISCSSSSSFSKQQQQKASTPKFLMVISGVNRNPDVYLNNWIDLAMQNNLIVCCPNISQELFSGSKNFNQGGIVEKNLLPKKKYASSSSEKKEPPKEWIAKLKHHSEWTFTMVIEDAFDFIRDNLPQVFSAASNIEHYYMFGHSAGSQFTHRFVMMMPENIVLKNDVAENNNNNNSASASAKRKRKKENASSSFSSSFSSSKLRLKAAAAANSGWYTTPSCSDCYPYGLANIVHHEDEEDFLDDDDEDDENDEESESKKKKKKNKKNKHKKNEEGKQFPPPGADGIFVGKCLIDDSDEDEDDGTSEDENGEEENNNNNNESKTSNNNKNNKKEERQLKSQMKVLRGMQKKFFKRKLYLLQGTDDTDEDDKNLQHDEHCDLQGMNRVDRGKTFFSLAETAARDIEKEETEKKKKKNNNNNNNNNSEEENDFKFNWEQIFVDGIAHSNSAMADTAAQCLFGSSSTKNNNNNNPFNNKKSQTLFFRYKHETSAKVTTNDHNRNPQFFLDVSGGKTEKDFFLTLNIFPANIVGGGDNVQELSLLMRKSEKVFERKTSWNSERLIPLLNCCCRSIGEKNKNENNNNTEEEEEGVLRVKVPKGLTSNKYIILAGCCELGDSSFVQLSLETEEGDKVKLVGGGVHYTNMKK